MPQRYTWAHNCQIIFLSCRSLNAHCAERVRSAVHWNLFCRPTRSAPRRARISRDTIASRAGGTEAAGSTWWRALRHPASTSCTWSARLRTSLRRRRERCGRANSSSANRSEPHATSSVSRRWRRRRRNRAGRRFSRATRCWCAARVRRTAITTCVASSGPKAALRRSSTGRTVGCGGPSSRSHHRAPALTDLSNSHLLWNVSHVQLTTTRTNACQSVAGEKPAHALKSMRNRDRS